MIVQQFAGVLRWATSALVYSRAVGVGVGLGVGVGVGVTTIVGVGEGVGEGVGVAITVGVGEGVGVGVATTVTTGVGVETGVGETVGVTRIRTPRLQTLLFPFFTQVNSRFFETKTVPTFLQDAPARGVFADALLSELEIKRSEMRRISGRRTCKV